MRSGAYGSPDRRTYGVLGERVNLAAQLMKLSVGLICDEPFLQALGGQELARPLEPILIKGTTQPEPIYELNWQIAAPAHMTVQIRSSLDALNASQQLVLKIASISGLEFHRSLVENLFPVAEEMEQVGDILTRLAADSVIIEMNSETFRFSLPKLRKTAYESMLFAQRRHLHRKAAEWYEAQSDSDPALRALAYHWEMAEELAKATPYLESAAETAREAGRLHEAEQLLRRSLDLSSGSRRLDESFYDNFSGGR